MAELRESRGEVRRERRLPHASLAARHRQNAGLRVDGDARRPLRDAAAKLRRERGLLLGGHHVKGERGAFDAGERKQRAIDLILEARSERTACDGERDRHLGGPTDQLGAPDHVELDHGAAELRVDHALERPQEFIVHVT